MEPNPQNSTQDAEARVAEAHSLLKKMREQLEHPDLDTAIEKLEAALSLLTSSTGGML
ncbi:MAG TPA: hypothetical protein VGL89_16200 [Candidatus Koribacter sp.]|jgi:hypothetical protein